MKKELKKLLNRPAPDWQNQKLILARKLVAQQKVMIEQNEKILHVLREIRDSMTEEDSTLGEN